MAPESASRDDAREWLRLTLVPGLGGEAVRRLLSAFGTPREVLDASRASVAPIVGSALAEALARGSRPEEVEAALEWLESPSRHLVALGDPAYPRSLLDTHDPPSVLYVVGRTELLNATAFAIVGSRNATAQGARDAQAFARALSDAGLAIVSGLALGVDAAAHLGGLAGRGSSLAVLGTGADRVYPARNRELAHALAARGAIVSEFPLGSPPAAAHFPRRNRIISGLSRGVLVVEAALASGSLTTARLAVEQGRDVFAIPGSIHAPLSKGCHALIKQGAKLVESAADVLEELGLATAASPAPVPGAPAPEDPLLVAMGFAPVSIDELARHTGHGARAVAARLVELEIEGHVAPLPGGLFQRLGPAA